MKTTTNAPRTAPQDTNRFLRGLASALVVAGLMVSISPVLAPSAAFAAGPSTSEREKSAHQATRHTKQSKNKSHKKVIFRAPTKVTPIASDCKETSQNVWDITVTYKVTGGRYANIGDDDNRPDFNDNVYRGGSRLIETTETWHGFPGDPEEPVEAWFSYEQVVAPIGKARNLNAWRTLNDTPLVTISC
jgi:hypothetical protein